MYISLKVNSFISVTYIRHCPLVRMLI